MHFWASLQTQIGLFSVSKNTCRQARLQRVLCRPGAETLRHMQRRSLSRTPVLLHLVELYCDLTRPRPLTYCLSTWLCSRAQKSNGTVKEHSTVVFDGDGGKRLRATRETELSRGCPVTAWKFLNAWYDKSLTGVESQSSQNKVKIFKLQAALILFYSSRTDRLEPFQNTDFLNYLDMLNINTFKTGECTVLFPKYGADNNNSRNLQQIRPVSVHHHHTEAQMACRWSEAQLEKKSWSLTRLIRGRQHRNN